MRFMSISIKKYSALETWEKLVLMQAWFMLGWMRAVLQTLPFKRLAAHMQHHRDKVLPPPLRPDQVHYAFRIGWLVGAAAGVTPWQSPCLAQVLVTQRLLSKRGIPGQFYLGVRRGCERTDDPTGLSAHAWLQCGDQIVNGAAGHEQYTVVSTFSWGGAP